MSSGFRDRGGFWVAAQFVLIGIVALTAALAPSWGGAQTGRRVVGAVLLLGALAVGFAAARALGGALTPYPQPRPGAPLTGRGPYRHVRHPMYSAVILLAASLCLFGSAWALLPTLALAVVLDRKAQREERWLTDLHPEYARWSKATRWRFFPGIR
jgi:protein-S-isoprenylcysteine O-methyltransferase Ste14